MEKKKKVILGLSGGVDSAVSAIILKEQGYDVEGVFMRNWDSSLNNDVLGNPHITDSVCPQEVDYMDALQTAKEVGIKLHRIDFVDEYWQRVFSYFLAEYRHNRTPNPDILCNSEIKFKAFLEKAEEMGCDYIAMGHYARSEHSPKVRLLKGTDTSKDQSYFLCQLKKEQIEKALFPVGNLNKSEVRRIAEEHNLTIAKKKDSTGVCFIGERHFKEFLENYIYTKKGPIIDSLGNILGEHDGIMYYTIGQRKGIGLGGAGEAWFVVGKDPEKNALIVGRGKEQELLYSNRAICINVNWLGEAFTSEKECYAKFRYRASDIKVFIKWIDENTLEVRYPNKFKAVTPGQAAVFYDGDELIGGATIDKVYMDDVLRKY